MNCRYVDSAVNVNINTLDDLKKALKENGYSNKAIVEIAKWYASNHLNA